MLNQEHERDKDQTHGYWYIPLAPRVNYSLLVMESAGMMKIATGEGFPLRQGARTGLDWFLVATKACGGETPDLGYFLEVFVFIGIFGVGLTSGGSPSRPRGWRARPTPWAHTPISWTARDSSGPTILLRGLVLVHKKSSKIGTSIGLSLVFLFCKTQKQGKNKNWHWALG